MIDLTPLEVRQKKGDFRRALRGYDPELVNDFLDLVADRMEELVRENLALRDAAETVQGEIVGYRQKEQALSGALMTAQRLREDARDHAEKESELLLREARLQAESIRAEVARQIVREEDTLRRIRARRAQLVESFRRLLDREVAELDIMEETLELDSPVDAGTNLAGLGGEQARDVAVGPEAREAPETPEVQPSPEMSDVWEAPDAREPSGVWDSDVRDVQDVQDAQDAQDAQDVPQDLEPEWPDEEHPRLDRQRERPGAAPVQPDVEPAGETKKSDEDETVQDDWLSSLIEE
jgi:cell division initiation protein